ncbi:uncharacterized protein LOC112348001 isoform X4 [Selaginella moellendorffii]|uniref:uncharacterized protein LOC112348001 isoform X4 n=1 Tax=Selaginella moellendorffii TaxID=88036 RepID=UPI000D1CB9CC|nr:uncharacterized protein LOC112348001 isoform X4 [Selaginella moellendorffii]|eukprot:XP_024535609.1 uncharacterized protein LOC112348001 isoform X4 [Selaginella moellendorffii]
MMELLSLLFVKQTKHKIDAGAGSVVRRHAQDRPHQDRPHQDAQKVPVQAQHQAHLQRPAPLQVQLLQRPAPLQAHLLQRPAPLQVQLLQRPAPLQAQLRRPLPRHQEGKIITLRLHKHTA